MKRAVQALVVLLSFALSFAAPAAAAEGPKLSLGYAYLKYLETDGGDAPLGAYLSGWGGGRTTLELDLAWHRDKEAETTFNTFTVLAGPRFAIGRTDRPYFHLLGGARIDKVSGSSNTSWGGAGGLGIDLGTGYGSGIQIRLGADFEIFWDHGENVKALRLTAGFTF
jgi:hypothetical protein